MSRRFILFTIALSLEMYLSMEALQNRLFAQYLCYQKLKILTYAQYAAV